MKKNKIFAVILLLIIIIISQYSIAKYKSIIEGHGYGYIAKPIFDVRFDDMKNIEIIKENNFMEYSFSVLNYIENEISELDIEYKIEIKEKNKNFPVSIKLFNQNNEEINLTNNISDSFCLNKNEKSQEFYKVIVNWKDKEGILDENDIITINVNAIQKK